MTVRLLKLKPLTFGNTRGDRGNEGFTLAAILSIAAGKSVLQKWLYRLSREPLRASQPANLTLRPDIRENASLMAFGGINLERVDDGLGAHGSSCELEQADPEGTIALQMFGTNPI